MNALAQRTGVTQTGTAFPTTPTWAWDFDPLGQLTSADHSTDNAFDRAYQYDAIANRQRSVAGTLDINDPGATTYTPNALNQYSTINHQQSPINPTHDFDGNATAYPVPAHPGANSALEWDAENRLISATINGTTTANIYDAQSRKIATTTGENTILSIYDDWNCIAEYSISNNQYSISKARLWGLDLSGSLQGAGGVGGLLSETLNSHPSTLSFFPTYDGNGNISEYIDEAGAIAAHFEYDPFGNTLVNTDASNLFAYRFSTKPLDFTTGLYYYGYRWYDPLTGRWPSMDPIEEDGGMNLYGFIGNDGLNQWDFLGLEENGKEEKPCCTVTITITRASNGKHSTLGTMKMTSSELKEVVTGYSLELKAGTYNLGSLGPGEGEKTYPIPKGTYNGNPGSRFNSWMVGFDVSGFTGIQIHKGNWPWNTHACILVGNSQKVDQTVTPENMGKRKNLWSDAVKLGFITETEKGKKGSSDFVGGSGEILSIMKKLYDDTKTECDKKKGETKIVVVVE